MDLASEDLFGSNTDLESQIHLLIIEGDDRCFWSNCRQHALSIFDLNVGSEMVVPPPNTEAMPCERSSPIVISTVGALFLLPFLNRM